ncbi:MAG: CsbD family protein [Prochloraceae cyanobacterium]|nr:CsbD family protein [Prochloraceae cyanobacterium]
MLFNVVRSLSVLFTCAFLLLASVQPALAMSDSIANSEIVPVATIAFDSDTAEKLDKKAKEGLDSVAGSGTSEQLEGKAQQAAGAVKENVDKLSSQAKGKFEQAKGKAKEDIGKTKSAIEDASASVQDAAEDTADKVKGFFN